MQIDIRESRPEDSTGIAAVQVRSWRSAYAGILPLSLLQAMNEEDQARMFETILKNLDRSKTLRATVLDGESIVGYVAASLDFSADQKCGADCELWGIYIDPEFQSKGAGKAAFEFVRAWLKSNGRSRILIWVAKENKRAQNFYVQLGAIHLGVEKTKHIQFGSHEESLTETSLLLRI